MGRGNVHALHLHLILFEYRCALRFRSGPDGGFKICVDLRSRSQGGREATGFCRKFLTGPPEFRAFGVCQD